MRFENIYWSICFELYIKYVYFKNHILKYLVYGFIVLFLYAGLNLWHAWSTINNKIGIHVNDEYFVYHILTSNDKIDYNNCVGVVGEFKHTADNLMLTVSPVEYRATFTDDKNMNVEQRTNEYKLYSCTDSVEHIEVYEKTPEIVIEFKKLLKRINL